MLVTNLMLLATQPTPFGITHNAWLSDNSQTIFTTDEENNGSVAAYNISDLNDIELLDEYRSKKLTRPVIPHNT